MDLLKDFEFIVESDAICLVHQNISDRYIVFTGCDITIIEISNLLRLPSLESLEQEKQEAESKEDWLLVKELNEKIKQFKNL